MNGLKKKKKKKRCRVTGLKLQGQKTGRVCNLTFCVNLRGGCCRLYRYYLTLLVVFISCFYLFFFIIHFLTAEYVYIYVSLYVVGCMSLVSMVKYLEFQLAKPQLNICELFYVTILGEMIT